MQDLVHRTPSSFTGKRDQGESQNIASRVGQ